MVTNKADTFKSIDRDDESDKSSRMAISARFIRVFIPVAVLYVISAGINIDVPGVYMDSVNPDYLVVPVLNPGAVGDDRWTLPGTMLFNRFPTLGNIYHGALPFYLGLPFYSFLGTGLIGIRLTHIFFGLLVLAGASTFLVACRVRPATAAVTLCFLSLDPGFIFSFRTQFYITLLPIALIFFSLAIIEGRGRNLTVGWALTAGVLAGIACYGYFIYFFLLPALAAHAAWRTQGNTQKIKIYFGWIAGASSGVILFMLGFGLIATALGGLEKLVAFLRQTTASLGVTNSTLTFGDRFVLFIRMFNQTILDVGPSAMMLGKPYMPWAPDAKRLVLVIFPIVIGSLGLCAGLYRRTVLPNICGIITCGLLVCGVLLLVLCFGDRLWLHHAALLLPICYVAVGLAADISADLLWSPQWTGHIWRWAICAIGAGVIAMPILITNLLDRLHTFQELDKTGGVGLASDAIVRFAEASLKSTIPVHMFFPDWGYFMPFAMITHGSIPFSTDFSPERARAILCAHKDAELVTSAQQSRDRLLAWVNGVNWSPPETTVITQRNGKPLLIETRWRASDQKPGACS